MNAYSKISGVFFILWGAVHIVGGLAIMTAALGEPAAGYAAYDAPPADYPTLAGAALAYLAYGFAWVGAVVAAVGVLRNWKNSPAGFVLNTALVGFTDLGLVVFFLLPGYLGWGQGMIGIGLFAAAFVFGVAALSRRRA